MRGKSIERFLPRQTKGGSDLEAVVTEAVSAEKMPQGEPSSTRILETMFLLTCIRPGRSSTISRASKVYRSFLYSIIVFISFFLMLVFMTYNVSDSAHAKFELSSAVIDRYFRRI